MVEAVSRCDDLYFYRDHVGNEVDLLLSYADGQDGFEIKSSRTLNPDFFRGLDRLENDVGKLRNRGIINGGNQCRFERQTAVIPWTEFKVEGKDAAAGRGW